MKTRKTHASIGVKNAEVEKYLEKGFTVAVREDGTERITDSKTYIDLGEVTIDIAESLQDKKAIEKYGEEYLVARLNWAIAADNMATFRAQQLAEAGLVAETTARIPKAVTDMFNMLKNMATENDAEGNPVVNGVTWTIEKVHATYKAQRQLEKQNSDDE